MMIAIQAWAPGALASEASGQWRFEPAVTPPPPPGVKEPSDAVPLGDVGQISFWAPNQGLLITGGTEKEGGVVPAGLYAYDGVNWHELASVCGGAKGRIAWAGPDEFWTIADQRPGQITSNEVYAIELESLSLCRFVGDEVVDSYAMPLEEAGSYLHMDAAACFSPDDCWFGGEDGTPPNEGSFHLHWNGSEVSVYYDSSDHAVTGMAVFGGKLYEGLAIGEADSWLPTEEQAHPPVIRTVAPAGETPFCGLTGESSAFCNVFLFSDGKQLPIYTEHVLPDALGGFNLATDGGPQGAGATQLWAAADPLPVAPGGSGPAKVTVLRDTKGEWTQVIPARNGGSPLPAGATLAGSSSDIAPNHEGEPGAGSIAPVPGSEDAWISLNNGEGGATVALLEADGHLAAIDTLPEASQGLGFLGTAGPIACPAQNDCWMATKSVGRVGGGLLFHLTDGASVEPNSDPLFDGKDGVIASRPPDSGVPPIYPDGFAEEDALLNQQQAPAPLQPKEVPVKTQKRKKAKPLVVHVKSRFLRHRTLVLTFTLTAKARVQLIARRKKRVVEATHMRALGVGPHKLSLTFDPAHWPTKLQFKVKPASGSAPSAGSESGLESNETITT